MVNRRGGVPRRILVAGVALLTAVTSAACSSSAESSGEGSTYLVGFPALASGPAAFAGVPIVNGAKLAVKEINDSGFLGEGVKIELKSGDIKSDPAQAIAQYRQYVADGASAILCCGLSSEAGALAPVIKQSKVPGIVTSAILPGLAEPPYVFRPVIIPSEPGGLYDQFIDDVVPAAGVRTAVLVVTADNDGMAKDATIWEAALKRNGVNVVKRINTQSADTNYTQAATEIQSLNPDAVVSSMLGTPSALVARALRERGYEKPILANYGVDSAKLYETSGGGLRNTIFFAPFHAEQTDNEVARRFVGLYQKEYGSLPDMYGAQGYTAMWLVAEALKAAGDGKPEAVSTALAGISQLDTVYGPVSYEGGQARMKAKATYLQWSTDGKIAGWTG
ncbi:branched-chain amino acid transport system substrate-binding protein [Micromonospora echinospora]|uniref:Branched-chain amino acid transport system substrate-binding protein n=1 Tax=Micromonospora echinospora TaxID=1877 RepID=A0A1C4YV21_MICEC|nr:branched-chain amino acid transport system substrate-binding protein [Micromonospora echinospora]